MNVPAAQSAAPSSPAGASSSVPAAQLGSFLRWVNSQLVGQNNGAENQLGLQDLKVSTVFIQKTVLAGTPPAVAATYAKFSAQATGAGSRANVYYCNLQEGAPRGSKSKGTPAFKNEPLYLVELQQSTGTGASQKTTGQVVVFDSGGNQIATGKLNQKSGITYDWSPDSGK
jgi:hypothetical protein